MDVVGHGFRFRLPQGWDGRVSQRSSRDAVTFEAASVRLAFEADDSFQQTEKAMGETDTYIRLSDIGEPPPHLGRDGDWHVTSPPISIESSDLRDQIEGHSLPAAVARAIVVNNRALMLYVGFGSWPGRSQLAAVNQILAGLEIDPGPVAASQA